ncbi:MAG: hypothetical protein JNJ54_20900 [Myxococcaceae bacterium]|nr:hypothetical protein [Myxococcaceae bacterium]
MATRRENGRPALPAWAKKPPVDGVLIVPTALAGTLKKALGPLGRLLVPSTRFVAFESEGVWGLSRQLGLTMDNAKDLRHALEVLASHDLPVLHLDLHVEKGAAGALVEVLASPAAARLSALIIGLAEPFEVAGAVASAVQRTPGLRRLELVARGGGSDVVSVVEAAKDLRLLSLVSVGLRGPDLKRLAKTKALTQLESLKLLHVQASDRELAALFASPWAKTSLRSLQLSRAEKVPSDYPGLGSLTALATLDLGFVSSKGLAAVAGAPFVQRLKRLALHGSTLDEAVARTLAAGGLPALEVLHLKWATTTVKAVDALVKVAPRLQLLELPAGLEAQKSWVKRGRQIL